MQLLITPLAAFDLQEIGDYIAQDNPVRAGSFVAELRAHCEKICLNPAGYRRRPFALFFVDRESGLRLGRG
jgi:toxin ParE1/3/4